MYEPVEEPTDPTQLPLAVRRNYDQFLAAVHAGGVDGGVDTASASLVTMEGAAGPEADSVASALVADDLAEQALAVAKAEASSGMTGTGRSKGKKAEEEWKEEGEDVAYHGMEWLGRPGHADAPPYHPSEGER